MPEGIGGNISLPLPPKPTSNSQNPNATISCSSSSAQNLITISDTEEDNYEAEALKILNQHSRETSSIGDEEENDFDHLYNNRTNPFSSSQIIQLPGNNDNDDVIADPHPPPANNEFRRVTNYKYSYSRSGKKNSRLLVPEASDKKLVRIYSNSFKGYFFCIGCHEIDRKRLKGHFNGSIFMAPIVHQCRPIIKERAVEEGKKNKEKAIKRNDGTVLAGSDNSDDNDNPEGDGGGDINDAVVTAAAAAANAVNQDRQRNTRDEKRYITLEGFEFHTGGFNFDPFGRIVVFEEGNRSLVREYRKNAEKSYYCYDCKHVDKDKRIQGLLKEPIFFAPPNHQHLCKAKSYTQFLKDQQEFEERYLANVAQKRKLLFHRCPHVSPPHKTPRFDLEALRNEQTPNDSVVGENGKVVVENPADLKIVKEITVKKAPVKEENESTDIKDILKDEKPDIKPNLRLLALPSYVFYRPSQYYLAQTCKKLNIKSNPEAYNFCNKMNITKILLSSSPSQVHETKETKYHGFSCFSLYFTAAEKDAANIREMINRYVYNNFKSLGQCLGHDFSQFTHDTPLIYEAIWSNVMTDVHFELASRWFDCRIAVYDGCDWKLYGSWGEADRDIPTFLMEYAFGKYNPILELED